jgi:hypothetical protein
MAQGECLRIKENEFCYSRATTKGEPCAKHVDYKQWNKAKIDSWGKYLEMRDVVVNKKTKKKKKEAYRRACEHHHIASVAEVGTFISNENVRKLAMGTSWCISEKKNLIAMPMWSLHLMYYCDFTRAHPMVRAEAVRGGFVATVDAPPLWANLPMHDQDHDLYLDELNDTFSQAAERIAEEGPCQDPQKTLLPDLDKAISMYHQQLLMNGVSHGGTHGAWKQGMNGLESWYAAFSMSRSPTPRPHPLAGQDQKWQDKLAYLHQAFWLES